MIKTSTGCLGLKPWLTGKAALSIQLQIIWIETKENRACKTLDFFGCIVVMINNPF